MSDHRLELVTISMTMLFLVVPLWFLPRTNCCRRSGQLSLKLTVTVNWMTPIRIGVGAQMTAFCRDRTAGAIEMLTSAHHILHCIDVSFAKTLWELPDDLV